MRYGWLYEGSHFFTIKSFVRYKESLVKPKVFVCAKVLIFYELVPVHSVKYFTDCISCIPRLFIFSTEILPGMQSTQGKISIKPCEICATKAKYLNQCIIPEKC